MKKCNLKSYRNFLVPFLSIFLGGTYYRRIFQSKWGNPFGESDDPVIPVIATRETVPKPWKITIFYG